MALSWHVFIPTCWLTHIIGLLIFNFTGGGGGGVKLAFFHPNLLAYSHYWLVRFII